MKTLFVSMDERLKSVIRAFIFAIHVALEKVLPQFNSWDSTHKDFVRDVLPQWGDELEGYVHSLSYAFSLQEQLRDLQERIDYQERDLASKRNTLKISNLYKTISADLDSYAFGFMPYYTSEAVTALLLLNRDKPEGVELPVVLQKQVALSERLVALLKLHSSLELELNLAGSREKSIAIAQSILDEIKAAEQEIEN